MAFRYFGLLIWVRIRVRVRVRFMTFMTFRYFGLFIWTWRTWGMGFVTRRVS